MQAACSEKRDSIKGKSQSGKPLRITLVGGHSRNMRHLVERAWSAGWVIERHSGDVGRRGIKELRSQIARADLVVITTRINSHGGMFRAKDYARRLGIFTAVIRRDCLAELENAIFLFQKNLTGINRKMLAMDKRSGTIS